MQGRVLVWSVVLVGCAHGTVTLPVEPRKAAEVPEAWRRVALEGVSGTGQTELRLRPNYSVALVEPLPRSLERVLRERLGDGGERTIPMRVEDVTFAFIDGPSDGSLAGEFVAGTLTVAANVTIDGAQGQTRLRYEQSVGSPDKAPWGKMDDPLRRELLTRAVLDLTDRLFYDPKALAALGAASVESRDSALLDAGGTFVTPVVGIPASGGEVLAAGRTIWNDNDGGSSGLGVLMLGDMKGFLGGIAQRGFDPPGGIRFAFAAGALQLDAGLGGQSSTLFASRLEVGAELGTSSGRFDAAGYVVAPGFRFSVIPGLKWTQVASGDLILEMLHYGGDVEVNLPLGDSFGLTAGVFLGSGFVGGGFFGGGVSAGFFEYQSFVKMPYGDIYFQTQSGRIHLGLLLQQAMSGPDAGSIRDNPTLTFTWEDYHGYGVAYSKSETTALGSTLTSHSKVYAVPDNAFADATAKRADLAVAVTPSVMPAPVVAAKPVKLRWLVLGDAVDPKLDKLGTLVRNALHEALGAGGADVVPAAELHNTLTTLGLAATAAVASQRDLAAGLGAQRVLRFSLAPAGDQVKLRLVKVDPQNPIEVAWEKVVTKAAMLKEARDAVGTLVK